jgi:hypothetical protein
MNSSSVYSFYGTGLLKRGEYLYLIYFYTYINNIKSNTSYITYKVGALPCAFH